jgi:hypothetical protein
MLHHLSVVAVVLNTTTSNSLLSSTQASSPSYPSFSFIFLWQDEFVAKFGAGVRVRPEKLTPPRKLQL